MELHENPTNWALYSAKAVWEKIVLLINSGTPVSEIKEIAAKNIHGLNNLIEE